MPENGMLQKRPMTFDEYQLKALRTVPCDMQVDAQLVMGALGVTGEAGELADLIKKITFQEHVMDKIHLLKECGDVLWYINAIVTALGSSLEQVATMNIAKLEARYPDGFDPNKSKHRKEGDV